MHAETATKVHSESIIIDGMYCKFRQPIPPSRDIPDMMLDHILASGVTAVNDSIAMDIFPFTMEEVLMNLYEESILFGAFPERILKVQTAEDIRRAKAEGKLGLILSTQGLASIGTNMRNIWVLYSLGVRIMQLTYNEQSALGCGCREPHDTGLTRFGQFAIEQMNRLGIVLDLSHAGRRTSLDAIEHSSSPPIFSHASVLALCNHPRNLSDEQIRAVAAKAGVVGVCPHSVFVEKAKGTRPSLDDYVDHIDHIAQLVGVDHVGIGTDHFQYDTYFSRLERTRFEQTYPGFYAPYGPEEKHVSGFSKWTEWPNVTAALLNRGFSTEDARKVLGGNFMRVFEQVWRPVRE